MSNLERINALYDAAGVAHKAATTLIAANSEMPAEVATQVEALLAECESKQAQARLIERADKSDTILNAVDESKRLVAPARLLENSGPGESGVDRIDSRGRIVNNSAQAKAFDAYLRHGERMAVEHKAALNETTAGEGGYLTPVIYSDQLVSAIALQSVMRQAGATMIPLTSDDMRVPGLTYGAAAVLTTEAQPFDEKEPTVSEIPFTPFKYTRLARASDEMVADSRFPLWESVLSPDFVQAFAAAENAAFTVGTGSGQPQGVVTGGTVGVTTASASAITSSEIIDLYHALSYQYRGNASWLMNDLTVASIRKLTEAVTGQFLWQPGLQAGQPDRLLGRPLYTNNSVATITNTAKVAVFGDFSYFWIGDREGLQIKVLQELYAGSGQVGYRAYKRFDSNVMLAAAIQVMAMHA